MNDADVMEILKLPADERLRLVELIWESLTATPSEVHLSDSHRAAVDEELAAYRSDPDDVLSLDQILSAVSRTR